MRENFIKLFYPDTEKKMSGPDHIAVEAGATISSEEGDEHDPHALYATWSKLLH